ncbi:hypothetical protein EJ110_NYTH11501 [Nymphaea thermarum]|nr:hypothetical protein EJ110_NYTH11501 [Nymphaea thermarum]
MEMQSVGGVMGSQRVIELQLVAFIMVFSASGLIPLLDLAFPIFTTLYLLILSRFAFPNFSRSSSSSSQEIFRGSRLFRRNGASPSPAGATRSSTWQLAGDVTVAGQEVSEGLRQV